MEFLLEASDHGLDRIPVEILKLIFTGFSAESFTNAIIIYLPKKPTIILRLMAKCCRYYPEMIWPHKENLAYLGPVLNSKRITQVMHQIWTQSGHQKAEISAAFVDLFSTLLGAIPCITTLLVNDQSGLELADQTRLLDSMLNSLLKFKSNGDQIAKAVKQLLSAKSMQNSAPKNVLSSTLRCILALCDCDQNRPIVITLTEGVISFAQNLVDCSEFDEFIASITQEKCASIVDVFLIVGSKLLTDQRSDISAFSYMVLASVALSESESLMAVVVSHAPFLREMMDLPDVQIVASSAIWFSFLCNLFAALYNKVESDLINAPESELNRALVTAAGPLSKPKTNHHLLERPIRILDGKLPITIGDPLITSTLLIGCLSCTVASFCTSQTRVSPFTNLLSIVKPSLLDKCIATFDCSKFIYNPSRTLNPKPIVYSPHLHIRFWSTCLVEKHSQPTKVIEPTNTGCFSYSLLSAPQLSLISSTASPNRPRLPEQYGEEMDLSWREFLVDDTLNREPLTQILINLGIQLCYLRHKLPTFQQDLPETRFAEFINTCFLAKEETLKRILVRVCWVLADRIKPIPSLANHLISFCEMCMSRDSSDIGFCEAIILLFRWTLLPSAQDANAFVDKLVRFLTASRSKLTERGSLELYKLVVSTWSSILELPVEPLLEKMLSEKGTSSLGMRLMFTSLQSLKPTLPTKDEPRMVICLKEGLKASRSSVYKIAWKLAIVYLSTRAPNSVNHMGSLKNLSSDLGLEADLGHLLDFMVLRIQSFLKHRSKDSETGLQAVLEAAVEYWPLFSARLGVFLSENISVSKVAQGPLAALLNCYRQCVNNSEIALETKKLLVRGVDWKHCLKHHPEAEIVAALALIESLWQVGIVDSDYVE
ncbi:hypothetical protein Ciccas_000707, partial [Cichlidogyrus casuarinus]